MARSRSSAPRIPATPRKVRSSGVRLAEAKAIVARIEAQQEIEHLRNKLRSMRGGRR